MKASPLILLDPSDNVLVCRQSITAGTPVEIDGEAVVVATDIPVGHKVARLDLAAGAKVLKYGAPIGSTTRAVRRGEHIHMHNMQSDYIPAHTRATTHAGDGH